jgi:sugar lactone lactonase YvrE
MRKAFVLVSFAVLALAAGASASQQKAFPPVISLPGGFRPEGIAIGPPATFYVGSIPTGAIYRGSLRTGTGSVLFAGAAGHAATGMKVDNRGRLFVSGATTGHAFVYDTKTGAELANLTLTTAASNFINDVVVTRTAAWFTDSVNPFLYKVPLGADGSIGAVTPVPLTGALQYVPGFNVNGIDATPDGNTLILVQSNTGKLFRSTTAGVTTEIPLGAGTNVLNGDGILLGGRILYVVQNQLNQIAKIRLDAQLRSGRVLTLIKDSDFDVPTTVARHGARLYAVNARFNTPPTPTTPYQVVQTKK